MGASYQTIHLFFLQTWFPILTVYMCTNSVMISIWAGYFVVYYFSKKFTNTERIQSVSERYQRFENLRTHKTMNWFVTACLLSLLFAFAYIHFLKNYKTWFPSISISDINMVALCRIILDTFEAYLFLIIPISFTFTHEKLKVKYLQIFSFFKIPSRISSSVTTEMQVIKSISGQNMCIKNEEEHHFNTLVLDWNKKFDKKG
uniref:Uncharacterized protein n=1 Tax=Panagrolaimus sp. PS1159 TaxID=55785 RepID=A0AC35EYT4_9BILA